METLRARRSLSHLEPARTPPRRGWRPRRSRRSTGAASAPSLGQGRPASRGREARRGLRWHLRWHLRRHLPRHRPLLQGSSWAPRRPSVRGACKPPRPSRMNFAMATPSPRFHAIRNRLIATGLGAIVASAGCSSGHSDATGGVAVVKKSSPRALACRAESTARASRGRSRSPPPSTRGNASRPSRREQSAAAAAPRSAPTLLVVHARFVAVALIPLRSASAAVG